VDLRVRYGDRALTGGREYYPGGAYPALLASGSIALEAWLTRRAGQIILVLNALATFALSLPIYPAERLAQHTRGRAQL
jgi:hypothetical protein